MFWAEFSQFNSSLFDRVVGQVEVLAGQVNSRGRSASNAYNYIEHSVFWAPRYLGGGGGGGGGGAGNRDWY